MDLEMRAQEARRYISTLRESRGQDWRQLHLTLVDSCLADRLVLLHPEWLRDIGVSRHRLKQILGERRNFDRMHMSQGCQAQLLWGYNCNERNYLQVDHLWPYSLGGPTRAGNAIMLCRDHNALKGVDIHVFPWHVQESTVTLWLETQLSLYREEFMRIV